LRNLGRGFRALADGFGLLRAFNRAASELNAVCYDDVPRMPSARLQVIEGRLDSTWVAVQTIQVAVAQFQKQLSNQQRARFNALQLAATQAQVPRLARADFFFSHRLHRRSVGTFGVAWRGLVYGEHRDAVNARGCLPLIELSFTEEVKKVRARSTQNDLLEVSRAYAPATGRKQRMCVCPS
jgi:hypothetical protein